MVVDVRTELARPDYDLARLLQRGGKPLFLAVNKVETEALANEAENLRRLGIGNVFPVSSEHGQGVGELLDAIAEAIPEKQGATERASKPAMNPMVRRQPKRPMRRSRTRLKKADLSFLVRSRSETRKRYAPTESLSSAKLRWRSSGGRTWARARCSMRSRGPHAPLCRRLPAPRATRSTRWWSSRATRCALLISRDQAQGQDEVDGGEDERGDGAAAS